MRALIKVAVVEVSCPKCGEALSSPDNGSHLWPVNLLSLKLVYCPVCKIPLSLSSRFSKEQR